MFKRVSVAAGVILLRWWPLYYKVGQIKRLKIV